MYACSRKLFIVFSTFYRGTMGVYSRWQALFSQMTSQISDSCWEPHLAQYLALLVVETGCYCLWFLKNHFISSLDVFPLLVYLMTMSLLLGTEECLENDFCIILVNRNNIRIFYVAQTDVGFLVTREAFYTDS